MTTHMLNGHLVAFWEQGMEGRIDYAFQPEGTNDISSLIWLADGHHLKIYNSDYTVLWEGEINLVSRRRFGLFYEQHDLENKIWNDLKQKGIPYKEWIAWFWHKPPLKAQLS